MKRKLLTQMRHNWRANSWMMVELIIVSTVLWAMFSILIPVVAPLFRTTAYTADDLYSTGIRFYYEGDPLFKPYTDSVHSYYTDYMDLISKIRENPHVVEAGVGSNLQPYSLNFLGDQMHNYDLIDSVGAIVNQRQATPDAIRALGLKGAHGQDTEELVRIIESGKALLAATDVIDADQMRDRYLNHKVFFGIDSADIATVGAIIPLYPRHHYEVVPYGTIILPLDLSKSLYHYYQLIIRVKPGEGKKFLESLTPDDTEYGNAYLEPIHSFAQARDDAQALPNQKVRNYVVCMAFLLICVFMGLFGTFWLRTTQNSSEIAIRKVNGATKGDIMRRFMSEGMILMVIAVIISLPIDYWLFNYAFDRQDKLEIDIDKTYSLYAAAASVVCMVVVVAISIWMPARRAMKVDPATALKSE